MTEHLPKRLWTGLLALIVVAGALCGTPAFAHELHVFAENDGGTVHGKAYFHGEMPAKNVKVTVLDPAGRVLEELRTDGEGKFVFEARFHCDHKLIVDAGHGHAAEFILKADKLPKSLPERSAPRVKSPEQVFNQLDANGDGKLTFDEFSHMARAPESSEKAMGMLPRPHYERLDSDPPWLAYAAQFHGHLGPWATAGTRLGMAGLRNVGAKGHFDIEVTCEGPFVKPPKSCFLDGLQVATGATLGKRNLLLRRADPIVIRVKNTRTGARAEVRPTPKLLELLGSFKPHPKSEGAKHTDHDHHAQHDADHTDHDHDHHAQHDTKHTDHDHDHHAQHDTKHTDHDHDHQHDADHVLETIARKIAAMSDREILTVSHLGK